MKDKQDFLSPTIVGIVVASLWWGGYCHGQYASKQNAKSLAAEMVLNECREPLQALQNQCREDIQALAEECRRTILGDREGPGAGEG